MVDVAKAFDPVHLSFLRALLEDAGIDIVVLDAGAGSIWPGAIPARIMVESADADRARRVLREAGIDE